MENYRIEVKGMNNPESSLKGMASLVIGNSLRMNGIKIVEGSKGLFVSFPQRKTNQTDEQGNPVYEAIFHATKEMHESLSNAVMDAYNNAIAIPEMTARVTLYDNSESNIKGFATIKVADMLYLKNVRIMESEKDLKLFISFPSYKKSEENEKDTYQEYFHAITAECRNAMNDLVLGEYLQSLQQKKQKEVKEEPAPVEKDQEKEKARPKAKIK